MPIRTHQIPGGSLVILRSCDGCGSLIAPFGTGRYTDALNTKDPGKVKCWCGMDGCVNKEKAGE